MKKLIQKAVGYGISFTSRNYIVLCLCVVLFSVSIVLIVRHRLLFMLTPDLSGVENYNTYWIQRFLAGDSLYEDPEKPPFAVNVYTPLYFYVVTGFGRLASIAPDDVPGIYFLGRAIAALSNVLFAVVLYRMGTHIFRLKPSLAGIATSLAFLMLHIHCYAVRPDGLYNLLVISSLLLFMNYLSVGLISKRYYYLIGSTILAVLALFTKQSAFFLPFLLGGYLLIFSKGNLRWKDLLIFSTLYAGFFGLLLWALSGNNFTVFVKSVIGGLNNGISLKWLVWFVMPELHLLLPLFVPGVIIGVIYLMSERSDYNFLGWSLLVLFVASSGTILKFGSHANYYTEFISLSLVAGMVFWQAYDQRKGESVNGRLTLFTICGFLCLFQVGRLAEYYYVHWGTHFTSPYESEQRVAAYLENQLASTPNATVFVFDDENTFLKSMLFKQVVMPHNGIRIFYPKRPFSLDGFRQYVLGGRVRFVVASHGRFAPGKNPYEYPVPTYLFQYRTTIDGYDVFAFDPASRITAAAK